jgi:heterodisulfide reductase subunit A-like polyferredoxin
MAKIPYEFLARWDHQTGALKGAHVKTFDDVMNREGDAQAVAVAGADGFPLGDILTAVEQGAIAAMEAAQTELATEKATHEATKQALAEVEAALVAAQTPIN